MTVVELHPDELFDKDARGALTEAERVRFESHLAQCAVCRAERVLRRDFAEERLADGIEDAEFSAELVNIALSRVKGAKTVAAEAEPEPKRAPSVPSVKPPRKGGRTRFLAAAAVLAIIAAGAHRAGADTWLRRAVGMDAKPLEVSPLELNPVATLATKPAPPVPAPPAAVTVREVEPEPSIVPVALPPKAAVRAAPVPAPRTDAAAMFDDANDARRRGDYARAVALHRELQAQYPATREAQVSRATLGRLLLDRGDLGSALESFDQYQSHGHGELDESVMVGRAKAFERLGRTAEARQAWEALLAAFPASPYAEYARGKLDSAVH